MEIGLQPEEQNIFDETLRQLEYAGILEHVKKYCFSDLGSEIILNTKPSDDLLWLRAEHDAVDEMTRLLIFEDAIPMEGISDVRTKLHKTLIQNAVLSPVEMLNLRDSIRAIRMLKNYFSARAEKFPKLAERLSLLHENRILEKHIDDAIIEPGEVRDNASRALQALRREIQEKSARLRSRLQKILKKVTDEDLVEEEFISIREGRFVLPVKSEHKRHIQGIIHGVSQTGATVFIEPAEIIEVNNDISLLNNEEKREVYKILSNLTTEIGQEAHLFLESISTIAWLDSVFAKARYANEFGGIKPVIHEENEISLSNIRHPLLVRSKSVKNVVPLSIEFSNMKRGHLISGPNAGGKTVALKSIGLNVLMALSGIFPLGECRTNIRTVFSSIGDRQSIENDLSTFSGQMLQMKNILSDCNAQSLVLIDEIGSGTDPQEGSALAAGILDTFIELNLFFVATTHQSSLKTYALNRGEIVNASLEFNEMQLKPTYKFLSGIPGNSYAFVLADSLGISSLVLDRARKYLGERHSVLEESISILQRYRTEAEEIRTELFDEREKTRKVKEEYQNKYAEYKKKRKDLLEEARLEARGILQNANSLVENTIREIREQAKPVHEVKKDYLQHKQDLEKEIRKSVRNDVEDGIADMLKAGDSVLLIENNSTGSVLEADNILKIAIVDFNGMKFRLAYNKLKPTSKKPEKKGDYSNYIRYDASTKLDVRGMRAEETLKLLDDFISQGLMSNLQFLTCVHGKGTGALRKAVHEFLQKHPSIVSFRVGDIHEGGDGVTIIEL
ncbi:MAG: mutS2 [Ignavibacteria bacterium]|nr:mutS2 [Ignavibacteria bacterium]